MFLPLSITLIVVLSLLPFYPLVHTPALYDDIYHFVMNVHLPKHISFNEILSFQLQPTRPVSNLTFALIHSLGGGLLWPQKLFSLLLHATITTLLFINALAIGKALKIKSHKHLSLAIASLYAIAPIHTIVLGVVSFRWEQLGTLFTLLGVSVVLILRQSSPANKNYLLITIFLCAGLAILSKETFGLFYPVALMGVHLVTHSKQLTIVNLWKDSILRTLGLSTMFWGGVLLILLQQPSAFPHHGFIFHESVVNWNTHLSLAIRSFIEQIYKTFTGLGLTSIRLAERGGIASDWNQYTIIGVGIFSLIGIYLLLTKSKWNRLWLCFYLPSALVYMGLPNINIGEEHYGYFSSIALFALLVFGIWKFTQRFTHRAVLFFWVGIGFYSIMQMIQLQSRIIDFSSESRFSLADTQNYPDSPIGWAVFASSLMKSNTDSKLIKRYLDRANLLDPIHPIVLYNNFLYYYRIKDFTLAAKTLPYIDKFPPTASQQASAHYLMGNVYKDSGNCQSANAAYQKASLIDPSVPVYQQAHCQKG